VAGGSEYGPLEGARPRGGTHARSRVCGLGYSCLPHGQKPSGSLGPLLAELEVRSCRPRFGPALITILFSLKCPILCTTAEAQPYHSKGGTAAGRRRRAERAGALVTKTKAGGRSATGNRPGT
jgi:hypothetical protein